MKKIPLYSKIIDELKERIRTGDFEYDVPFVTEEKITKEYNVSRITAIRALDELEKIGVIYRKRGSGSFVTENGIEILDGVQNDTNEKETVFIKRNKELLLIALVLPFDVKRGGMMECFNGINDLLNSENCFVRVYNTLGTKRKELVTVELPQEYADFDLEVNDYRNKKVDYSIGKEGGKIRLLFEADVPPFGYSTYRIKQVKTGKRTVSGSEKIINEGEYVVENDMYKIVFDLSKGGIIKSLVAKKEENKEFAKQSGEYSIGELRGYFYDEGKFRSSTEAPAKLTVLRSNIQETKVKLEGKIASHPFVQIISIAQGEKRIDFDLTINWKKNVGIGEYKENSWRDNRRAYCDDRFKLSVLFPVNLHSPRIYKNAPFDVCESKLDDTFFNSWDQIKHNIILHWVDLAEQEGDYALALFADHTTSYSHGKDYPLGLTAQYSGNGLWGPDYKITGPLKMKYAIVPHRGKWDKAAIATKSDCWNEPLLCSYHSFAKLESRSLVDLKNTGYQVSAANIKDGKIILRLFNAEGDRKQHNITFDMPLSSIEEVDLNGRVIDRKTIKTRTGKSEISISMPRFGLKTFALNLN